MFCITQTSGDILPGEPQGLFVHDTRVLSRWSMTGNGGPSGPLAVQQADPAAAFVGFLPVPQGAPADADFAVNHAVKHARAASWVPRGNGGPGGAANTPPGHARPWGVS